MNIFYPLKWEWEQLTHVDLGQGLFILFFLAFGYYLDAKIDGRWSELWKK